MAWDLTVSGVSKKAVIDTKEPVVIKLERGERSSMEFTTLWEANYVPARYAPVIAYAKDGTTPIFGGMVLRRKIQAVGTSSRRARVTCTSWWLLLDTTLVTVEFAASCTLKAILEALISQLDPADGFTLDPAQPDGPTFSTFVSGKNVRAADVIRKIQTDTAEAGDPYVPDVTPLKVVSMNQVGSVPAPFSLTDADPHCRKADWVDPTKISYNRVVLTCGGDGEGEDSITHTWPTANGSTFVFTLQNQNVRPSLAGANVVVVDGISYPIWPPSMVGPNDIEWDPGTNDGTLTFHGDSQDLVPNGAIVSLTYTPRYPFTVIVATGATPVRSIAFTASEIRRWSPGLTRAEGLLAEVSQEVRALEVFSLDDGWRPSQTVTVDLSQIDIDDDFTIGPVTATLRNDDWWEYTFTAHETTVVQQSKLEAARKMIRSASGVGGGSSVGGGGGGISAVSALSAFLGGSHSSPVVLSDQWQPISHAVKLPAQTSTFTALIECETWTYDAGVSLRLRLQNVTDDTTSTESAPLTPGADRNAPLEVTLAGVIAAGKKYQLQIIADDTPDEGKEAYVVTPTLAALAA